MKKGMIFAACALAVMGLSSCSQQDDQAYVFIIDPVEGSSIPITGEDSPLTRSEETLVQKSNDFAFNLLRATATNGKNLILSPLSITYALGLLNNGATGQTQQEISQTLGYGDAGTDEINDFCKKMLVKAAAIDTTVRVLIANNIFVNKQYELKPAFVAKAAECYFAPVMSLDFSSPEALSTINAWADKNTEGMIDRVLNELDPDVVSYLLNAIYFKGVWSQPFFEEATQDEPFGGMKEVPMMHQRGYFSYADTELGQLLTMPYGLGHFQMTVLLPHEDRSVSDVLGRLNSESWQQALDEMKYWAIDLKLPRFESDVDMDLVKVMQQLGMQRAFTSNAEFANFCSQSTFIGLMKQVARIKVNEKGTEAAAVTVIGMEMSAGPDAVEPEYVPFYADRPFIYVISERTTGTVFFVGQYLKP